MTQAEAFVASGALPIPARLVLDHSARQTHFDAGIQYYVFPDRSRLAVDLPDGHWRSRALPPRG